MTETKRTALQALRDIDAIDRRGHNSEVAAEMGLLARLTLWKIEEEKREKARGGVAWDDRA